MPRRRRHDAPGQLHHVMNRGLSGRPLFDLPSEQRRFLALLACAVRAGRIRVHACCLMNTHYHLIVESLDGDLSATMGWIQSRHSQRFNRTRERDGTLVRGRFKSIPIDSRAYLFILFRYVDLNPVKAGLCEDPLAYEFGTARLHAISDTRPRWIARDRVESFMGPSPACGLDREETYRRTFHKWQDAEGALELVGARLAHMRRGADDLDALLRADGAGRREWIVNRAQQADGTKPGLPMVDAGTVLRVLQQHRLRAPAAHLRGPGGRELALWNTAEVGLLRDLAGLGYTAMARLVDSSPGTISKRYGHHRFALNADPSYVTVIGELARQSLETCFGPRVVNIAKRLASAHVSRRGPKNA